jgi:hypothetical protein
VWGFVDLVLLISAKCLLIPHSAINRTLCSLFKCVNSNHNRYVVCVNAQTCTPSPSPDQAGPTFWIQPQIDGFSIMSNSQNLRKHLVQNELRRILHISSKGTKAPRTRQSWWCPEWRSGAPPRFGSLLCPPGASQEGTLRHAAQGQLELGFLVSTTPCWPQIGLAVPKW